MSQTNSFYKDNEKPVVFRSKTIFLDEVQINYYLMSFTVSYIERNWKKFMRFA